MAGENDLDVTATWDGGIDRRLLVEDKVRASFQPLQAQRYMSRASSRPHTRCLLVAPRSFEDGHPKEVQIFRECGGAITIEDLANELESAEEATVEAMAQRLAWRAALLHELTIGPVRTPDHPPTVVFSAWCTEWLAGWARCVVPTPIRTINEGWIYFSKPNGLFYKCSNGYVDLQVNHLGKDRGADEVGRRVNGSLPPGFDVATDTVKHTVLRYPCEMVSPQRGLDPDGQPVQAAGIKEALAARVAITRWLEEGGGRGRLFDELPENN